MRRRYLQKGILSKWKEKNAIINYNKKVYR